MSPASVFDLREENMMLENLVMLAFVAVLTVSYTHLTLPTKA